MSARRIALQSEEVFGFDFGGEDGTLSQMRSKAKEADVSVRIFADNFDASVHAQECSRLWSLKSINTRETLIAILATSGSNRLALAQYSFVRNTINWVIGNYAPHECLVPSCSTAQRPVIPALQRKTFLRSEKHFDSPDLQKDGAQHTTPNTENIEHQ